VGFRWLSDESVKIHAVVLLDALVDGLGDHGLVLLFLAMLRDHKDDT